MLPAFSGLVPPSLAQVYPNAVITNSSGWGSFPPTQVTGLLVQGSVADDIVTQQFLDPVDPLFRQIQLAFLKRQTAEYGTDHLYNCDLCELTVCCGRVTCLIACCRQRDCATFSESRISKAKFSVV